MRCLVIRAGRKENPNEVEAGTRALLGSFVNNYLGGKSMLHPDLKTDEKVVKALEKLLKYASPGVILGSLAEIYEVDAKVAVHDGADDDALEFQAVSYFLQGAAFGVDRFLSQ